MAFKDLPPVAQTIIVASSIVVTVSVGVGIYFAVKKRIGLAGSFKEKKDVTDALKNLAAKNIKPSYSPTTYSSAANMIFTALDGVATDEGVVKRVFQNMKNDADILSLMDAYGIREVRSGIPLVPNFKGTMAGAIADEFDEFEIKPLNKILTEKGITITF